MNIINRLRLIFIIRKRFVVWPTQTHSLIMTHINEELHANRNNAIYAVICTFTAFRQLHFQAIRCFWYISLFPYPCSVYSNHFNSCCVLDSGKKYSIDRWHSYSNTAHIQSAVIIGQMKSNVQVFSVYRVVCLLFTGALVYMAFNKRTKKKCNTIIYLHVRERAVIREIFFLMYSVVSHWLHSLVYV